MNKFFQDNGYLSDHGKKALSEFKKALMEVLSSPEVKEMNEAEFMTLQANLGHLVDNEMSKEAGNRREEVVRLNSMSDENFEAFLAEKYGPEYMLKAGLTKAELDRSMQSFHRRISAAMEEGFAIRNAVIDQTSLPSFDPGLRFK